MAARLAKIKAEKEAKEQGNGLSNNAGEAAGSVHQAEPGNGVQLPSAEHRQADSDPAPATTDVVLVSELQPAVVVGLESELATPQQTVEACDELRSGGSETDLDLDNPIHQQFLQKLSYLEDALLRRDPMMKHHLATIHKTMIEYDEIPVLLRPQEIAKIMAAQQAHTNVVLAVTTAKKAKKASSKALANLSIDDI